jgi:hypothetical protein
MVVYSITSSANASSFAVLIALAASLRIDQFIDPRAWGTLGRTLSVKSVFK